MCIRDRIRIVDGDMPTIMAGLACGEPNTISWDILKNHVSVFTSCPDWVSARGMRMLAAPVKGDPQVTSGESGAVGMGLLSAIMEQEMCIRDRYRPILSPPFKSTYLVTALMHGRRMCCAGLSGQSPNIYYNTTI